MKIRTLPVNVPEEIIVKLDSIALEQISSRTRIIRLAIKEYIENNGK